VLAVRTEEGAGEAAAQLAASLRGAGIRVELDARTELPFGRRAVGWELKGVPVRLEVGPRDLANGTVVLCRRDDATKTPVRLDEAVNEVGKVLEAAQAALMAEALKMRSERTVEVSSLEEVDEATQSGFAMVPGSLLTSGDGKGEQRLNAAGVSVRALQRPDGSLPSPDEDAAGLVAVVARAY
jgi:prolyl-tRNA synthetase